MANNRRRSSRIRNVKLAALDQFKHSDDNYDVDMSDSNKNTKFLSENDDVSSASNSEDDYQASSSENDDDSSNNSPNSDSSSSSSSSSDNNNANDADQFSSLSSSDNDNDSDSDFIPGKSTKKKAKKKKKTIKIPKKRGRKRKHSSSESDDDDDDDVDDNDSDNDFSGSDEEYKPNQQQRKKRKTNNNNDLNVRRSARNLGKETVKYDDRTQYGDIDGLYDDDDNQKQKDKSKYKTIMARRKRGGVKRLKLTYKNKKKYKKSNDNDNDTTTNSTSNSIDIDDDDDDDDNDDDINVVKVPPKPLFTYSTWLDDIESDTECQYHTRGRPFPAKINHVSYVFEIKTDLGLTTTTPQDNRIRAVTLKNIINAIDNDNDNDNDNKDDKNDIDIDIANGIQKQKQNDDDVKTQMDIDTNNNDADNADNSPSIGWYKKLKVNDSMEYLNDENKWEVCVISFINRKFELQYTMRRSLNHEEIWEFDKNKFVNYKLRLVMRPPSTVIVEDTPTPLSSISPIKKRKIKKKSRFQDSDDSDEESDDESESEEYDEDDDISHSRSTSISPIDNLQTKIESILYSMQIPRCVRDCRDTFNHLMPKTDDNKKDIDTNSNSKEEMDIDTDEKDKNDMKINDQKDDNDNDNKDKTDIEMEDKENIGDNIINVNNIKPNSSMIIESDEDDDILDKNAKNKASLSVTERENELIIKYLVKYWNRSYHHVEWLSVGELRALDAETKMINFDKKFDIYNRKGKKIQNAIKLRKFQSVHFFNDLYLEIDRIISVCEPNDKFDVIKGQASSYKTFNLNINTSDENMYLVKWNGLQYDEATWEMESFLRDDNLNKKYNNMGNNEIGLFEKRQKIPLSKYLHPSPKKLNMSYFKNKPRQQVRVETDQIFKNGHKLRGDYQRDGINWLLNNWRVKIPSILADEMGLGKTVQTVTFVDQLYVSYHRHGPFLIVAPLSTLGHWQREFRSWSDMNVIVYHGSQSSRERMQIEEFSYTYVDPSHSRARTQKELDKLNRNNFKFNVMITTPQIVNQDYKTLNNIYWDTIIIDEAHSLKSCKSLFYKTLLTFKNNYTHTVLLTGTPIQNNMEELWCLLHFMDEDNPSFLDQDEFVHKYGCNKLTESRGDLKKILAPRLLQRLKYLVEKDLCQREEKIIWVELTLFQKKWYKALYQKSYDKLRACGAAKASLMNVSMQLRKCCNHPFLMKDVERTISPIETTSERDMNENLIKSSGKLVLLDKLLPKLKNEGHRILIFSQMSHLLDILEDYLNYRSHLYERLDGSVTGIERQEAIDRFQKDDSIFVFLLTTRAGGVGINLMAADTVIIYDSDWNPMNDVQAIARAHRIGQKKQVNVYRLITRNCYEEEMFKRADQKLALNKIVMGDMKDLRKNDIHNMLKQGAISMFLNNAQTDEDIKRFADSNIDDILAQRTEVIKHDDKDHIMNDPDAAMFSEAVFVANAADADINVEDENFWEVLGLETEKDDNSNNLYTSPFHRRRRTRLQARNAASGNISYDSDGFSLDDEFEQQDGESLLGCLSYIIYGRWQQIFDGLTHDEKEALQLINDDDDDDNDVDVNKDKSKSVPKNNDDDNYVPSVSPKKLKLNVNDDNKDNKDNTNNNDVKKSKPITNEQLNILKQASIETICKMCNLMKPEIRVTKLGAGLKKVESMLYDKEFRLDCISTLAQQIYDYDLERKDWQTIISVVWNSKLNDKNVFTDKLFFSRRPNLCKKGCKRLLNPDNKNGKKYDTCCSLCAKRKDNNTNNNNNNNNNNTNTNNNNNKNANTNKPPVHDVYCETRHYRDFRTLILTEAIKTFFKKHPLKKVQKDVIIVDDDNNNNNNNVNNDNTNTNTNGTVAYQLVLPDRKKLVKLIRNELAFHDSHKIILAMKNRYINVKHLREQLKNKEHGDIVSILLKLERMFKFKIFCNLYKNDISKIDFTKCKKTKQSPEWWSPKWDTCLVDGTLQYGWGNVLPPFAIDNYQFTNTYKGPKKEKKLSKKEKELLAKQNINNIANGIENVKLNVNENKNTNSSPMMIVKKRKWIPDGKKQESRLISISNHFRKEIRVRFKHVKDAIKRANKLREHQILYPSSSSNIGSVLNGKSSKHHKRNKDKKHKKHKHKKNKNKDDNNDNKDSNNLNFNKNNDITNYFAMDSNKKNAFAIMKEKSKKHHKNKKDKKESKRYEPKLTISFDDDGNFKMPIIIGRSKMVKSLGEICTEPGYHATGYIYPVGFKCIIKNLPSLKRKNETTAYCTEIQKGPKGPIFEITCSDDKDFSEKGGLTKIWTKLWTKFAEIKEDDNNTNDNNKNDKKDDTKDVKKDDPKNDKKDNKSPTKSPRKIKLSGQQKIGLSHHDIKRVIECLPNALLCVNYKFKYRNDRDNTFTSKKAFKKTLKPKKDKKDKSKKDKKHKKDKKSKKKSPKKVINGNNNNNNDIISLIEDSPAANPIIPSQQPTNQITNIFFNNGNNNINNNNINVITTNINHQQHNLNGVNGINGINNGSISNSVSRRETIDLCDSDNEDDDINNNIVKNNTRKRKFPSTDDNTDNNNNNNDDNQHPKKKRRIEKQPTLNSLWQK